MSKKLVKILCLCALALLVPLAVVGIALSVTEPVLCTLTIDETGDMDKFGPDYGVTDLSIRVEGKEVDGKSVKVKKNSEVTVVFVGDDYTFEGWFRGKADEVTLEDTAVSFDKSYSFILRGNTTLTAIRNYLTYTLNVKYNAVSDEKASTITYNAVDGFSTYEYSAENARPYYTFKGLSAGNVTYLASEGDYVSAEGAKLSDKIKSGEVANYVTAVWECDFSNIYVNLIAAEKEQGSAKLWDVYGSKNGSDDQVIEVFDLPVFFEDVDGEDYYDLQDNIYYLLMNQYENVHLYDNDLNAYEAVYTGVAYVSVDDVEVGRLEVSAQNMRFISLVDCTDNESFDGITEISITFIFEKGEAIQAA